MIYRADVAVFEARIYQQPKLRMCLLNRWRHGFFFFCLTEHEKPDYQQPREIQYFHWLPPVRSACSLVALSACFASIP